MPQRPGHRQGNVPPIEIDRQRKTDRYRQDNVPPRDIVRRRETDRHLRHTGRCPREAPLLFFCRLGARGLARGGLAGAGAAFAS